MDFYLKFLVNFDKPMWIKLSNILQNLLLSTLKACKTCHFKKKQKRRFAKKTPFFVNVLCL